MTNKLILGLIANTVFVYVSDLCFSWQILCNIFLIVCDRPTVGVNNQFQ